MKVYAQAMARSFLSHFAKYGKEQLRLWMLITHPEFRRRGAGTMLCDWGERESAKRGNWILTLEASPMGKGLYEHLGYKLVGTEKAQVEGEDEVVDIYSMEKNN
jgi:ribosomal protein S18 acetylase RimI-like enzyme